MSDEQSSGSPFRGKVTWNSLEDERLALNRRLLLAMQNHDEALQAEIREQMKLVQEAMDRMCAH